MEQELPERERGAVSTQRMWTNWYPAHGAVLTMCTRRRQTLVSSPQNSTDSDRQMEEEDKVELSDEPMGDPADGPTDETAAKHAEGHPHNDELTEDYPCDDKLVETIMVKCPPSRQESPPGSTWEDRVVIHASEDEMDCLC